MLGISVYYKHHTFCMRPKWKFIMSSSDSLYEIPVHDVTLDLNRADSEENEITMRYIGHYVVSCCHKFSVTYSAWFRNSVFSCER
jgi:hypothetical protein